MTTSDDDKNQHPLPLSQRRVDPAAGKRAWVVWLQENAGDVARGAALVLTLAAILCIRYATIWHRESLRRRARQAPLQHGIAVVVEKQINPNSRSLDPRSYLLLRMNGTVVQVNITQDQAVKWARTYVGQTITTSYHAANGAYFVDDWDPPATRATINGELPTYHQIR